MAKRRTKAKPSVPRKSRGGAEKQTQYRTEFDSVARNLVEHLGATDEEVGLILNKSAKTIQRWKAKYPSFRAALLVPLEIANQRIDQSHFKECIGYWVEEEEIKVIDGKVVRLKKKVWIRPSPTAIIWWDKVKRNLSEYGNNPPPPLGDDGATTLDDSAQPETDRQFARRLLFIAARAEQESEDAA